MRTIICTILILIQYVLVAQSTKFYADRLHSSINFSISYLEIMELEGKASDFYAVYHYDPDNLLNSSVYIIVDAKSLNTGMVNRDRDLHSTKYLETSTYPSIVFIGNDFFLRNDSSFVRGTITIKNETREVEIPYEIKEHRQDLRKLMVIGVGPLNIYRSDFKIGKVEDGLDRVFLGDRIKIEANVLFRSIREEEINILENVTQGANSNNIAEYIGDYQSENKTIWSIELHNNDLFYVQENAAIFRKLTPLNVDRYLVNDIAGIIQFDRNQHSELIGLTYYRGSRVTKLRRIWKN